MIIIQLFIFFIVSFFAFIKLEFSKRKILLFCIGLFLFLLAALRPVNSDRDYKNYIISYNIISNGNIVFIEPAFYVIVYIVKYIFNDTLFLFIIFAILGVTLKFTAIKHLSEFWFLSLVVYISYFYILHEMTQIRVGVAAGLMLLAIKPIYERDIKKFLCYTFFAFLFHYSAILILLIWFIPTHKVNRWFYTLLIPFAYLLYFCNVSFLSLVKLIPFEIFQRKISMYITSTKTREMHINIFNVMQLIHCSLAFLFLWKLPLLKRGNRYIPILLQCYVLSVAVLVVFQDFPVFAFRVSEFLGCVEIILVPCVFYIFKSKQVAVIFIVVMSLGIFLVNIFYNKLLIV